MAMTRLAYRSMIYPTPDYMIAQAIQTPASKFSNWTLGRAMLPTRLTIRLSLLFGCQPADIIGWVSEGRDASAELPCLEGGVDTDVPAIPKRRRS